MKTTIFNLFQGDMPKPVSDVDRSASWRECFKMRPWQTCAFEQLKDEPLMILNAPTGSGKSSLMCYIATHRMYQNPLRKCIISMPQETIRSSFSRLKYPNFQMPDGIVVRWDIGTNLCLKSESKKEQLIEWLRSSGGSCKERTLLCTHATLVEAFKELQNTHSEHLLQDLLIWIDEAHHVKNEWDARRQGVDSNEIGKLVRFAVMRDEYDVHLGLTTATFIRGDGCTLLTPEMEECFTPKGRFDLPYDDYLKSCQYLRSFSYTFVLCGPEYFEAIGDVIQPERRKDIIYIPHTMSNYLCREDKNDEVRDVIGQYKKRCNLNFIENREGVVILGNEEGQFKILDLVQSHDPRRLSQKAYLDKLKEEAPPDLDAIIAMGMFKEGSDWECANRCFIVGPRNSLGGLIQMAGRTLRDCTGKEHAEVFHILPFSIEQQETDFPKKLNAMLIALSAGMLLVDIVNPIRITLPMERQDKPPSETAASSLVKLSDLVPNHMTQQSLLQDVAAYLGSNSAGKSIEALHGEYQRDLPKILEAYPDVPRQHDGEVVHAIGKILWRTWQRLSQQGFGIDPEEIPYQLIHPVDGLLHLVGHFGCRTYEELRKAFRDYDESKFKQGYEALESYYAQTKSSAIPQHAEVDGVNLFNFATVQRRKYKQRTLPEERRLMLENLSYWYWDYHESRKIDFQDALKTFFEREDHTRVPTTHKEGGFPLGIALREKLERYLNDELSREEVTHLESFPDWAWKSINERNWDYGYFMLKEYASTEGHAAPPSGTVFKGFKLSVWVKGQRAAKKEGQLSQEKCEKLDSLPGWMWTVYDDINEKGFAALDCFVARESHALVPVGHIENGFPLGRWIAQKRQAKINPKSKNKISSHEIERFESYPWWFWDANEGKWERGKHFLLQFVDREGHSRVKSTHTEGPFELGKWLGMYRHLYKKKKLEQTKINFFESLPKWTWDVKESEWLEALELLEKYVAREGHALVPIYHIEDGFQLGVWVRTQRYSYAKQSYGKKLSEEKIQLLEAIPGWVWKVR